MNIVYLVRDGNSALGRLLDRFHLKLTSWVSTLSLFQNEYHTPVPPLMAVTATRGG